VITEEISGDLPLLARLAREKPELADQLRLVLPAEGFKAKPTVQ
jgi:hypothetical protein